MNTATLAPFVLANTTIVIDTNGQIRPLLPGEIPGPGEVIVTVGRGATAATESSTEGASFPDISAEFVQDGGTGLPLDLDSEIASIIEQIEEGVDPTQNEDFATAAGGQNGSSLTGSGDIDRTGAETQAETFFDTSGLESQGLSETQSLALIDLVEESLVSSQAVIIGDDNVAVFETDEPVVVEGTLIATDTDDPTFIPQADTPGTNGLFSIDEFGNWTFVANSAFDELNVGDALSEDFEVTASDGTVSTVTVTINGTNDLPEFSPNDGDQYSFSYEEGTAEGVTVGQVSATDPDNEVLAFSITSNITDGEGNDLYQIDPVTGEISLTAEGAAAYTNDFEVLNNAHNLVVTVIEVDGLGTPQSVDVDVVLNELNIDDNAPIFNDTNGDGDYVFNYDENSTDAYVIGTVSATDADGEDVTYSIKTNVYDADNNPLFEIDELTGEISLTEDGVAAFSNDYETLANTHNLVVTATEVDGLGEVKTSDVDVILNEQNLDDNGPIFNDTNGDGDYVFNYDENSTDAYVIGTVSATDADGEDVTYSIKTNVYDADNNPLFEIDELTGEISLTEDGVIAFSNDYETLANTHNLVVTATEVDGLGEVKTSDVDVILNEQNLDDNGPIFNDTNGDGDYVFNYDENSTDAYVIGTVSATDADGEDVTYSIKTNVYDADNNPLFEIDELTGEISLTEDGVIAFSNDYETLANTHNLVVTATEVDGLGEVKTSDVDVILNEQNLDDNAPVFDPNDGDQYAFTYEENNTSDHIIGTVSATDADGEDVTYSIKTNIKDGDGNDLFAINSTTGAITLTTFGVLAFTNNYEALANVHTLVVTATEVDGFGIQKFTDINVELSELNVNELPMAEDFLVDAGSEAIVPIVFDSDIESEDHISDEDDDFTGTQVNIMLTSLPQYGVLLYTDDMGVTRELTEADLHVVGEAIDANKLLDPNNIVYVPGAGDPFELGYSGDPNDVVVGEDGFYNWGEYVSDSERLITLDNGNTITITLVDNNDKPLKQYNGQQPHVGFGIGDSDGQGMNKEEHLIIDLSNNPLEVVTFGLDGMGGAFIDGSHVYIEVIFTLADGSTHTEQYQKDPGDTGNAQILYEFTYSSPDNPIVSMDMSSTGGNWELRYITGTQEITEDVTFDYLAVDSELALSEEAKVTIDVSESPAYQVLSAANGDALNSELGNEVMVGDDNANVFSWLDDTLDNGTDIIKDFVLDEDIIDLDDVLDDTDSLDVDELITNMDVEIVDDDLALIIEHEDGEQTIILEDGANILGDYIAPDNTFDSVELLSQIIKNDAA